MHLAKNDSLYLRFSSFTSVRFPLSLPARILGSLRLRRRTARLLPTVLRLRNFASTARTRKIVSNLPLPATTFYYGPVLSALVLLYLFLGDFANRARAGNVSVYLLNLGKYTSILAICTETYL
jgi:hypothetical protein